MSIKGFLQPSKIFASIVAAVTAYGASIADLEAAGQADLISDRVKVIEDKNLDPRVKALESAAPKAILEIGPFTGTGVSQTHTHVGGFVPRAVIPTVIELPTSDGHAEPAVADCTDRSAESVKVVATNGCRYRLTLFA